MHLTVTKLLNEHTHRRIGCFIRWNKREPCLISHRFGAVAAAAAFVSVHLHFCFSVFKSLVPALTLFLSFFFSFALSQVWIFVLYAHSIDFFPFRTLFLILFGSCSSDDVVIVYERLWDQLFFPTLSCIWTFYSARCSSGDCFDCLAPEAT